MAKILIVEDDPVLVKMYQKKFETQQFDVEIARDGEEGIRKLKEFFPDIVLMDIMMPKLNGIEALEKIKQDDTIKDIPILILTNLSTSDDAQTAIKKGAAGYLVKSDYTPSEILEKVKQFLQKSAN